MTPHNSPAIVTIGNDCLARDLRGLLPGTEDYPSRPLSDLGPAGPLRWLCVHHTAGGDRDFSALEIAAYHVDVKGWPGIGYHFLVHWDGVIDYVGDILTIRWSVARRNHEIIAVCLPGDWTHRSPGLDQLLMARHLLANLQFGLGWPVPIVGHRDIALPGWTTACPGNTWSHWQEDLQP